MPTLPEEDVRGLIGRAAPDFTLQTDSDEPWCLAEQLGNVTVLLFYPQNETLVCTRQLCSVRDNWEDYLKTKAVMVGISPGTPDEHRTFSLNRQLPIPLLADPGREITRKYSHHWLFPVNLTRAIVVIDAHGIVRNRDVMLRAFRAAGRAANYGHLCRARRRPNRALQRNPSARCGSSVSWYSVSI